jgi:hypothetical protein
VGEDVGSPLRGVRVSLTVDQLEKMLENWMGEDDRVRSIVVESADNDMVKAAAARARQMGAEPLARMLESIGRESPARRVAELLLAPEAPLTPEQKAERERFLKVEAETSLDRMMLGIRVALLTERLALAEAELLARAIPLPYHVCELGCPC